MTTLIGLVTKKDETGVILASDLTTTHESWETKGDVAVRKQSQTESRKIHVSDDKNLAVSMAGLRDTNYTEFLYDLIHGKIDFQKSIKRGSFKELLDLNLSRFNGGTWQNQYTNSLLIATNYGGEPKLWTCFPLGRIEERIHTSVGSGSEDALNYINRQTADNLSSREIDIPRGIYLVTAALHAASADLYTRGLDIVVLTKTKTYEFGDEIKTTLESAKRQTVDSIANKFKLSDKISDS